MERTPSNATTPESNGTLEVTKLGVQNSTLPISSYNKTFCTHTKDKHTRKTNTHED